MTSYDEMAAALRGAPDLESGGGVNESAVNDAEARLAPLPGDYRQFLMEFGWSMFGGTAIWGLGEGFFYRKSFVQMTLEERSDFALPETMIAFSNDGAGNLWCFAASNAGVVDDRVYIFLHETRTAEVEAESFADFIEQRLSIEF